jgi:putative membrane protein
LGWGDAAQGSPAHDGAHGHGAGAWTWNLRPEVLGALGALVLLYARGLHNLWSSAGLGRSVSRRQAGAFGVAVGALVLALVSPIDVLAGQLGWVHMLQHELIMMVAAPLLVLGSTLNVLLWSLPRPARRLFGRSTRPLRTWRIQGYIFWQPVALWLLFAATIWSLHLPALYLGALRHRALHDVQHLLFLVTACLFWRVLLDPLSRLRLSPILGVLYLFTTTLHASALGVFMAFSPQVWYPDYERTTPAWNLAPLEDQQLAGYLMWMPACLVYAGAAAVLIVLWLHEPEGAQPVHAAPRAPGR